MATGRPPHIRRHIIRIAITHAAFEEIAATLPLGSVGYENEVNEKGERLIWLDRAIVDRLTALRAGESYSDVIMRLVRPVRAPPSLDLFCHPSTGAGAPD